MGKILKTFRKIINSPSQPANLITLFLILFILIAVPLITIELANSSSLETRADENKANNCPLTINDKLAPTIYFQNPKEGDRVTGSNLLIKVSAYDDICVQKVFLSIDGKTVKEFGAPPYVYLWGLRKAEPGTHTISAQAVDSAGNFSLSSVLIFRGVKNDLLP